MTRWLAGSGAAHVLLLAGLAALTSPPHGRARGGGGGGSGLPLEVLPLHLERATGSLPGRVDPAAAQVPPRPVARAARQDPPPAVAPAALHGDAPAVPAPSGRVEPRVADVPPAAAPAPAADGAAPAGGGEATSVTESGGFDAGAGPGGETGGAGPLEARTGAGGTLAGAPVPLHVALPALPPGVDAAAAAGARVRILVAVSAEGDVEAARVLDGSGIASLDEAAVQAALRLRYLPATRDGAPVATLTETEISF